MPQTLRLDFSYINDVVPESQMTALAPQVKAALDSLLNKSGRGSDFLGWIKLPFDAQKQLTAIQKAAKAFEDLESVVCVGIGGSYLGTKATIEALGGSEKIHYAGHHLSPTGFSKLLDTLSPKKTGICVVSKSGTTTEPAVAFRILKTWVEKKVGAKKARKRIVAVTDQAKGALKGMADQEGYATFVIPDDVGGRYSVLTPVGLLPIAIAGFDISQLLKGAQAAAKDCQLADMAKNPAARYAAARFLLYQKGKTIEVLANFRPGTALRRGMVEAALRRVGRQGREGHLPRQRGPDHRPAQHGPVPSGGPPRPVGNHPLGRQGKRGCDRSQGPGGPGRLELPGRQEAFVGERAGHAGHRRGAQGWGTAGHPLDPGFHQ